MAGDARRKGGVYSTNPNTVRTRQSLNSLPPKTKELRRTTFLEYRSLRTCCITRSKKSDYIRSQSRDEKLAMLREACRSTLANRQKKGTELMGTDVDEFTARFHDKALLAQGGSPNSDPVPDESDTNDSDGTEISSANDQDFDPNTLTGLQMANNAQMAQVTTAPSPLGFNIANRVQMAQATDAPGPAGFADFAGNNNDLGLNEQAVMTYNGVVASDPAVQFGQADFANYQDGSLYPAPAARPSPAGFAINHDGGVYSAPADNQFGPANFANFYDESFNPALATPDDFVNGDESSVYPPPPSAPPSPGFADYRDPGM
ncbi:hypothetical protein ColKHC_12799 [Colletotrichum higginsianum]|uniref:Uncharacterized protein n=1 Tax=Colletotrichum higginsianum TaxID=80884 RepID=A0A4T0VFD2_9PEZI|nr:hypothetical protein CH35J_011783 [Colletotrichum higginsianum]GJD03974.1 hypothetical protein ColKHC_12799 [Colletotrichum higginsianum]